MPRSAACWPATVTHAVALAGLGLAHRHRCCHTAALDAAATVCCAALSLPPFVIAYAIRYAHRYAVVHQVARGHMAG